MTIIKRICDSCGKEVDWLYEMPYLCMQGKKITAYERHWNRELCEDCAADVINIYKEWKKVKKSDK